MPDLLGLAASLSRTSPANCHGHLDESCQLSICPQQVRTSAELQNASPLITLLTYRIVSVWRNRGEHPSGRSISPAGPAGPLGPGAPRGPASPLDPAGPLGPSRPSRPVGPRVPWGPGGPGGPSSERAKASPLIARFSARSSPRPTRRSTRPLLRGLALGADGSATHVVSILRVSTGFKCTLNLAPGELYPVVSSEARADYTVCRRPMVLPHWHADWSAGA